MRIAKRQELLHCDGQLRHGGLDERRSGTNSVYLWIALIAGSNVSTA